MKLLLNSFPLRFWHSCHDTPKQLQVKTLEQWFACVFHRILLGKVLCQHTIYLKWFKRFSQALGLAALVIGQFVPFFMAPLAGSLASYLVALFRRKVLARLTPVVQERMDNIQRAKMDPTFVYEVPLDFIQWLAVATGGEATTTQISDTVLSLVSFPGNIIFLSLFSYSFSSCHIIQNTYVLIYLLQRCGSKIRH